MPTLTSINVHPAFQEKIAALEPPIETPHALLSRDPTGLAKQIGVPISHIMSTRCAVADALVSKERHGKEALRIKATLKHSETNNENEDISNRNPEGRGEAEPAGENCAKLHAGLDSSSLVLGSVSVLDLCLYESLRNESYSSLSTGSSSIDQLLSFPPEFESAAIPSLTERSSMTNNAQNGGIPFGYVTQVNGPPASGKTQLALMTATKHASNSKRVRVYYLASGVGNGAIYSLIRRLRFLCPTETCEENVKEGISFVVVSSGYQALMALASIETELIEASSQGSESTSQRDVLIILDSASGCLSVDLFAAGDGDVGIALAYKVGCTLKRLARQFGAGVLVTNGTVSKEGKSRPAMGQYWKCADIHLLLTIGGNESRDSDRHKDPNSSIFSRKRIFALLDKHPAKACHDASNQDARTASFAIEQCGITDLD